MTQRQRGSIREVEPGVWDVQVSAGSDPGSKQRRRLTKRVRGKQRDAERVLTALQAKADEGADPKTSASVAYVLEEWFTSKEHMWSPTTKAEYRRIVDKRLVPRWGATKVRDLDESDLEAWHRSLLREGLSAATVRRIHAPLRTALNEARRWKWIDINPASECILPPEPHHPHDDMPSMADAMRVVAHIAERDPDMGALYAFVAATGLRRSEACGLRWRDVDLDDGLIHVRQALVVVDGVEYLKLPKSARSRRTLRIDPQTVEVLRVHRDRQWVAVPTGFVWSTAPDGSAPVLPGTVTQLWIRARNQVGVKARLHDLRHISLSALIAAGIDVLAVSRRAGHSKASLTLDFYGHAADEADERAAAVMGGILGAINASDETPTS